MNEEPEDVEIGQPEQSIDLSSLPTVDHKFDHIVGNQLMCSLHTTCTSITVPATAVLEYNQKGELELIDKAVR